MVSVVIGLILSIGIGAILVDSVATTLVDRKVSTSTADFNTTIDAIVSYAWITFGLLALGILIVGAVFILQQVNLL